VPQEVRSAVAVALVVPQHPGAEPVAVVVVLHSHPEEVAALLAGTTVATLLVVSVLCSSRLPVVDLAEDPWDLARPH
jgi:hypothetical protein